MAAMDANTAKKHFWIGLSTVSFLIGLLISLLVYMWQDHKQDSKKVIDTLTNEVIEVKTYNKLIVKYILLKDGIDLDMILEDGNGIKEMKRLIDEGKLGSPRGELIKKEVENILADNE